MSDKLRIGIIGAGWWAANAHAPAIKATGKAEIVAVCRRNPDRLREFAERVGVPATYGNAAEMLEREALDAAIVCSPHALHYEHVRLAVARGLHVLTDKPLALTTREAKVLVQLAELQDRLLAVYFGPAYDSAYRYAAAKMREGAFGRILHAEFTYFANPDALGFFGHAEFPDNPEEFPITPTQFRADPVLGGGGYLQDVGNHGMSALLIGTGLQVTHVNALMDNSELDLRATVQMRFEGGATGIVTVGADMRPRKREYKDFGRFAVIGESGGIWRDPGSPTLWRREWDGVAEPVPEEELPPKTNPDENFINAILGGEELIAPGSAAVECVRAIEAAYESARTGGTIAVNR